VVPDLRWKRNAPYEHAGQACWIVAVAEVERELAEPSKDISIQSMTIMGTPYVPHTDEF
jgi:hypothetical protein